MLSAGGRHHGPVLHTINSCTANAIGKGYAKHGRRLDIAGTHIYVDPQFVAEACISGKEPMLERLLSVIEPDQTFMDVGAYVGTYSIPVAQLHKGSVNVIAFEPTPQTVLLFRKHLAYNRVKENVRIENVACSDFTGDARFRIKMSASGCIPSFENHLHVDNAIDVDNEDRIINVGTITIDDYLVGNSDKPDFIKVDVEGAELLVLKGARGLLSNQRPVVFCELHKFNWDIFKTTESQLRDLLVQVGYEMKDVSTGRTMQEMPLHCYVILLPI
jgi:FkbM family methyltransferase